VLVLPAPSIYDVLVKAERMGAILDRVAENGSVDVPTLSREFGVSAATIRRDLQALHHQGLLRRTHGEALPRPAGLELPLQ